MYVTGSFTVYIYGTNNRCEAPLPSQSNTEKFDNGIDKANYVAFWKDVKEKFEMEHGAPPASSKHATLPLFKTLLYSYSILYSYGIVPYPRLTLYLTSSVRTRHLYLAGMIPYLYVFYCVLYSRFQSHSSTFPDGGRLRSTTRGRSHHRTGLRAPQKAF